MQKTLLVNSDQNVSFVDTDMTTPKHVFMSAVLFGEVNVTRGNLLELCWGNCTNVQPLLSALSSLLVNPLPTNVYIRSH
jgi:hypothetical protein